MGAVLVYPFVVALPPVARKYLNNFMKVHEVTVETVDW